MAAVRRSALLAAVLALPLLPAVPVAAQDLVGCQLVGASLQCVPGVTESPQLQIRQLRQQLSTDLQLEGAVQQQIDGLKRLELSGEAAVGALLTATAGADAAAVAEAAALPQANYHWYRRQPNQNSWVLIESATGTTYLPASIDVGQQVMVVAVVKQNGAVKRLASAPVGPIQP